jgi:hypothetical protein
VKNYLLGTKAVHAPLNGLQDGDAAMATLCRPNKALLGGAWVSGVVTCGICLQRINSAHVEALKLNEAYSNAVAGATTWLKSINWDTSEVNGFNTYSDLFLSDEREALRKDLHRCLVGPSYANFTQRLKGVGYYAHRLTLVEAEIARRAKLHEIDRMQAKRVHDVAEAERIAHTMNPRDVVFEIGLGQDLQLHTREVPVTPKRGPSFSFTDHPHDQIRAQRYDSTCHTLLEMVAKANRPAPTTEELVEAILGLEHGEAIQEDSARFPHASFTRFAVPLGVNHQLDDGTVERVWMVGSDVSRRIYPQNMVLITRDNGMAQVVPEGSLVD